MPVNRNMHSAKKASGISAISLPRTAAIPIVCLLLGLTATVSLYVWSARGEQARGTASATQLADSFRSGLSARIHAYIDTLPGLKALADLEKDPHELRFTQFVSAISLQQHFPGLAFYFTANRVGQRDLNAYVKAVQNDRSVRLQGRPDFSLSPPGERAEYLIIRHTSPDTTNTLGYDLLDPGKSYRREVQRAIDTGTPIATAPVVLARNRDEKIQPLTASVVVRLATYHASAVPATVESRRQALQGIVGVALQTRYLIESTLTQETRDRLSLRIVDKTEPGNEALVFDDSWLNLDAAAPTPGASRIVSRINVANRKWAIEATDRAAPISYWIAPIPQLILISGVIISILLSLLMRTLVLTTRKAEGAAALAMAQLEREQQSLEEAQSLASIGSWNWDLRTGHLYWSDEMCRLYEMSSDEWLADRDKLYRRIPEEDRVRLQSAIRAAVREHKPFDLEHEAINSSGESRVFHSRGDVQRDETGEARVLVGTVQDITSRKRTEAAAAANELRYRLLFENSLDGVLQVTPDGSIIAANPAACALFGLSDMEMVHLMHGDLVDPTDTRFAEMVQRCNATGKASGELRMRGVVGSYFDAEISSSVYTDLHGRTLTSVLIRDVTERKRNEREISRLAFKDGLTGLPNRRLLMNTASQVMADAEKNGKLGAVLFIDLDNFKTVNDAKGHATGDALLCQVAERLKSLVRDRDTVARLGGDEFVILFSDLAADEPAAAREALLAAERIKTALSVQYSIEGRQYLTTVSIGVSIFPTAGQSCDDLLREADTAMYRAKAEGRNRVALFVQAMQAMVEEQLSLAHALEQAVRNGEMHMVAQAQYDHAGKPCGAELLLRWTRKEDGPVSPLKFIPLAEETGLIVGIGDWVIEQGCKTVAQLQARGLSGTISVNVSPRQFRQPNFVDNVSAMLTLHRVRPGQLIFEVTEGLLIGNLEETAFRMRQLNALGIRFSIDDFGTGYSSLAYLKMLPLYELKIDKTFVQDAPVDPNDTAIVQLILGMARHLKLRVVAEGVETREQHDLLVAMGCDGYQGFLLATPRPVDDWLQLHATQLRVQAMGA